MERTMKQILTMLLAFVMVFTGLGIGGWGIESAYAAEGVKTTFTVPSGCNVRVGKQANYYKYEDAEPVVEEPEVPDVVEPSEPTEPAEPEVPDETEFGEPIEPEVTEPAEPESINAEESVEESAEFTAQGQEETAEDVETPVQEPVEEPVDVPADEDSYTYNLTPGRYYFVVDDGENASYWQWVNVSADNHEFKVTQEDLAKNNLKTNSILRVNERSSYDVADIYMNTNEKGFHHLKKEETFTLESFRNWQTVESSTQSSMIAEPNFHFQVLDLDGKPSDTVTVEADNAVGSTAKITGKNTGTAIVLVTYDALINPAAMGGPSFSAIWPENTGVFVVQVGGEEAAVQTNMNINGEQKNKLSGAMIDAQHDVIYYLTEQTNADGTVETVTDAHGEYTFKPEEGSTVKIANPVISDGKLSFNGFKDVNVNEDGSYTVRLTEGSNIVKVTKGGSSTYQIVRAKGVKATVNNLTVPGFSLTAGDQYSVTFDTLYHPASKLAGVYNQYVGTVYQHVDGYDRKSAGGKYNQYNYPQTKEAQTVGNIVEWKYENSSWLMGWQWKCNLGEALTVPADYAENQVTLSGGKIFAAGYGEKFGSHRKISHAVGSSMGGMATSYDAYFGQLPDIIMEVKAKSDLKEIKSAELIKSPEKTTYFEGDIFDSAGMEIKVTYEDGSESIISSGFDYSANPMNADTEQIGVRIGKTVVYVTVSVKKLQVTEIVIQTPPAKLVYTEGEYFNPTGMTVVAKYNSGKMDTVTTYSYTNVPLKVGDTEVSITFDGKTVMQPVTVNPKSEIPSNKVTVKFTLLGDDKHDDNGDVHTYKAGNLTTWISETTVEVATGSTVNGVLVAALAAKGIGFSNAGGNYVSSINGLSEFDNGPNSGWMYLFNGVHSKWGVAEQKVKEGDTIVFHYTDDYTKEDDADKWDEPEEKLPSVGGSVDSIVKDNEATSTVKKSDIDKLIADAVKNEASAIELIVKGAEKADKVIVELPKQSVKDVADKTDASLKVSTPEGSVILDRKVMGEIVKAAEGDAVKVIIEKVEPSSELQNALGTDITLTDVTVLSNEKEISTFGTAKLKLHLNVPTALKDKVLAAAHVDENGKLEKMAGKKVTVDGKTFFQIETPHLSQFVVAEESAIDAAIAAQDTETDEEKAERIKNGVKNTTIKVKSVAGKTKGKHYIKLTWKKSKGYKVDYFEVYKSTKKGKFSKTPYFKTKKGTTVTYKNTKGLKKGTRYYYKVRGVRKIDGKKVYTKWSNQAIRISK